MNSVLTITLNPALDVATSVARLVPTEKLRCEPPLFDAGGGGLNVARVLRRLGTGAKAMALLGGASGAEVEQHLLAEGIEVVAARIGARTRENLTVTDRSINRQYRFVLPGPKVADDECERLLTTFAAALPGTRIVVASGSLPPGIEPAILGRIGEICNGAGVRLAVDTSGPALGASLTARPWLVKPNLEEFSALLGRAVVADGDAEAAARKLVATGSVENLLLSLAGDGALLATREGTWRARPPAVELVSAIGAGDSMLGAFVVATLRGDAPADCLRYAVAAGTAALMTPGTELCRPADVDAVFCSTAAYAV